jgi:hypothetical protein
MNTNITTQPNSYEVISRHAFADVLLNTHNQQKCLQSTIHAPAEYCLCKFYADKTLSTATYLTVQTGAHTHITLKPAFIQYINHSCDPNVFFNTSTMELVTLKDIAPGDELRFFYPSTEWDMAQPFVCNCGSPDCLQLINGAAHINLTTLKKYTLTDFIEQQLILQKAVS